VGALWEVVGQPLLFGVIGAQQNLHALTGSIVPRAMLVLTVSIAARIAVTYFAVAGALVPL
jgi:hypothetical protein